MKDFLTPNLLKGHGRQSSRLIQVSTELRDFLARDWYEVGQVFCVRRRVQYALKCTQEDVYGLTSLTPKQAGTYRLLELIREHWSIENRLHWRRDVTLAEDACQVRKGSAPHALAVLNSFVLALFDCCGVTNARAVHALRRCSAATCRSAFTQVFSGEVNSPDPMWVLLITIKG